jgi:Spy/CpxP family protein refolding chaperone
MARELGLSGEQKSQIRKVLAAEREAVGPLLKKLHAAREQVAEARDGAKFDEAALRTAAERENGIRTELLVAHARSRSRINALLTPEQREMAEDMAPPVTCPARDCCCRRGSDAAREPDKGGVCAIRCWSLMTTVKL